MDTKWSEAYLSGVRNRWVMVDYYEKRIKQLEDQLLAYGSTGLSNERVQSSPQRDALEKRVIRFVEDEEKLIARFYDQLDAANKKQDEAMERIGCLKEGNRKSFLIEYYVNRLSIRDITALFVHSDEASTRNLKAKALEYFERVANENGWKKIEKSAFSS